MSAQAFRIGRLGLGPVLVLGFCSASAAPAEDIVDVLRRSQDLRLHAQPAAPADDPRTLRLQASFDALLQQLEPRPAVELRVVTGAVIAETLHGHIVVANAGLADMPESVRLFVLAHELGHVVHRHWLQTALLYQKWIPGAVTPERTDPVAGALGREASALAHEQEFAADAYAASLLQLLGRAGDDALLAVFAHLGATPDTVTHPGTRRRAAALRAWGPTPAAARTSSRP